MSDFTQLLHHLHRLNDLECSPPARWVAALSPGERWQAIEVARRGVPGFLLAHHDSLIGRGRRSLVPVISGTCGACHLQIPQVQGQAHFTEGRLDVCDHCGAFLEWPEDAAVPAAVVSLPSRFVDRPRFRGE